MKYLAIAMLLLTVSSCRSIKEIPIHTTTVEQSTVEVHDTIEVVKVVEKVVERVVKDSIRESATTKLTVTVNSDGDTLRTDKETEILRDRYLQEENNRLIAENDSLRQRTTELNSYIENSEKEVVVEVEKPLSWWQSFRLGAFWYLAGALLLIIGLKIWSLRHTIAGIVREILNIIHI